MANIGSIGTGDLFLTFYLPSNVSLGVCKTLEIGVTVTVQSRIDIYHVLEPQIGNSVISERAQSRQYTLI